MATRNEEWEVNIQFEWQDHRKGRESHINGYKNQRFNTKEDAEMYSLQVALATGRKCKIKTPDEIREEDFRREVEAKRLFKIICDERNKLRSKDGDTK